LIFILWMIFLIVIAVAAWHWWGKGIFREGRTFLLYRRLCNELLPS
jgi:hypothetical protein